MDHGEIHEREALARGERGALSPKREYYGSPADLEQSVTEHEREIARKRKIDLYYPEYLGQKQEKRREKIKAISK